jgi:hypothetical protein
MALTVAILAFFSVVMKILSILALKIPAESSAIIGATVMMSLGSLLWMVWKHKPTNGDDDGNSNNGDRAE